MEKFTYKICSILKDFFEKQCHNLEIKKEYKSICKSIKDNWKNILVNNTTDGMIIFVKNKSDITELDSLVKNPEATKLLYKNTSNTTKEYYGVTDSPVFNTKGLKISAIKTSKKNTETKQSLPTNTIVTNTKKIDDNIIKTNTTPLLENSKHMQI